MCETEIPDTGEHDPLLRGIAAAPSIPLPMFELQPGECIDEVFEIVGVLGAGGMGVVYEAKDLRLDRRVAIKLHRQRGAASAVSPMLREAQTMARVRHPNVITVHAVGTHDEALFIAMEYIGGGTLRAWLAAQPRTIPEILDVFVAAGQGLAAAHRVGLVHRDFKPDNVLMDEGDRPRVADFGIARVALSFVTLDTGLTTLPDPTPSRMSATASRIGGIVGTPAYASPEQLGCDTVDARSDQFSFFVALHEALYGRLPFELDPLATLGARIHEGLLAPVDPARQRTVPRAVRAVVARGLSSDRALRFPDMDAALVALRRARARPRRIAVAALACAGVAGMGGLWLSAGEHAKVADCSDGAAQLVDVWDPPRKLALASAMVDESDPTQAERYVVLANGIDSYAAQWTVEWRSSCTSAAAAACLSSARARLNKLLLFFEQAGPRALVFGTDAIAQLPEPSQCVALEAPAPTADDAAGEQLRARLQDARLRYVAQPGVEDFTELVAIADDAEATGHEEIGAQALALAGERLSEHERAHEAEAVLRRAATLAVASGSREAMVAAWSLLASVLADEGRVDEAAEKLELARGSARGMDDTRMQAALAHNGGLVLARRGRLEDAIASFEHAIVLNTEVYGPQHREVAVNRGALGHELRRAGRIDDARTQLELALMIMDETSGELHPFNGQVLQSLGQLHVVAGDFDRADRAYARALAVYEHAYGEEGNPTLRVLADLAGLRRQQGRLDESLAIFEKIYARGTARTQTPGTALGEAAGNLAVIRATRGDWQGALELAQVSRDTFVAALGEDDAHLVQADTILGTILRELGRLDASVAAHERAHALAGRVLPVADRERINAAIELGHTLLARGERDAAEKLAEQVLAVLADPPGPPPVVAEAEFLLARALGPESPRAHERARHALTVFAGLGEGHAHTVDAIRAWLGEAP